MTYDEAVEFVAEHCEKEVRGLMGFNAMSEVPKSRYYYLMALEVKEWEAVVRALKDGCEEEYIRGYDEGYKDGYSDGHSNGLIEAHRTVAHGD